MLPKTAEYALRATVCLGRDPKHTESADRLAEQTKVPRRYLHKVLQDLIKAKLVRSQPGPGGGYGASSVTRENHDSRRRKCGRRVGTHSTLSVGAFVPQAALSIARRVGSRLCGDRSRAVAGNNCPTASIHEHHRAAV